MRSTFADRLPLVLTALAFGAAVGTALTRLTGLQGLPPPVDLWVAGVAVLGAAFTHHAARRRAAHLAAADPLRAAPPADSRPAREVPPRRSLWPAIRGAFAVVGAVTVTTFLVVTMVSVLFGSQIRKLFGASATGLRGETVAEAQADRARVHELDSYRTLKTFAHTATTRGHGGE